MEMGSRRGRGRGRGRERGRSEYMQQILNICSVLIGQFKKNFKFLKSPKNLI